MKIEWNKLLKNRMLYVSLASLLAIVTYAVIEGIRGFHESYDLAQQIYQDFPDSLAFYAPARVWIGLHANGIGSQLYYFIFPLLVSLPIVDSFYREKKSGFLLYTLTRKQRSKYELHKYLTAFVSSFLLFIVPLTLGILIINAWTGVWDYSTYSEAYRKLVTGTAVLGDSTSISEKKELFSGLLGISPYLYILVYYVIGALYAAIYTCLGLALSWFVKNRYLVLFIPFGIYMAMWTMGSFSGMLSWDPFNFLNPIQPVSQLSYPPLYIVFILLFAVCFFTYLWGKRKYTDVLS